MPAARAFPESTVSLMLILSLAVQVGLIAHVIKTGRSMIWILAIAFLPLAGSLAYVVVEILPEVFGGRTARRARSGVGRMLDPDRDLRRAAAEVEVSGNVDARRRLADELGERGQFDEAAEVYQGGLNGIFEHDPALLLGLAQAQFGMRAFDAARATLERLRQHNPEFNSSRGAVSCMRARSRSRVRWKRPSTPTPQWRPASPARKPGCATRCCSSAAAIWTRRGAFSKTLLDGAKLGPAHYRRAQARVAGSARVASSEHPEICGTIAHRVDTFGGASTCFARARANVPR